MLAQVCLDHSIVLPMHCNTVITCKDWHPSHDGVELLNDSMMQIFACLSSHVSCYIGQTRSVACFTALFSKGYMSDLLLKRGHSET